MEFLSEQLAWFFDPANWRGAAGIPQRVLEHVIYSVSSSGLAMLVALPVGLAVGHTGKGGEVIINISNFGRAVPSLGVIILAVVLALAGFLPVSGLSVVPVIVALVLLAIPPIVTNSYVGVRNVDREVRESAEGMGMSGLQVLLGVEIPVAMPLIMAGIRTSVVQVVATATLGAFVGLGGLGRFIIDGLARRDAQQVFGGGLLVALLALATEFGLAGVQRLVVSDGLRQRDATRAKPAVTEAEGTAA